jgi:hypothetical protein
VVPPSLLVLRPSHQPRRFGEGIAQETEALHEPSHSATLLTINPTLTDLSVNHSRGLIAGDMVRPVSGCYRYKIKSRFLP